MQVWKCCTDAGFFWLKGQKVIFLLDKPSKFQKPGRFTPARCPTTYMTLRRLHLPDLPLLQTIGRATYEPYYTHLWHEGGVEWYLHRCFNAETLTRELQDPNIEYYLAEPETGRIAGLLKLVYHAAPPATIATGGDAPDVFQDALYLEKIYLMPEFFGKGVGQVLLSMIVQKAQDLGRKALWLQVMHSGPVTAYEKAGFKKVGESRFEFDLLRMEERGAWVMLKML